MKVKIFRERDIKELEKDVNEFIDNDYISVKDIKVTTDVVYDKYDKNRIPTHISLGTTVAVMYEETNYGYY